MKYPTWGYWRVHGELCRLGYQIAPSSVWKMLRVAGIEPTLHRTGRSWAAFIRSQAKAVIATDFCCVDTVTLLRLHILSFIEIETRRVHLGGITTNRFVAYVRAPSAECRAPSRPTAERARSPSCRCE